MKVKDLIERLNRLDPTGEIEVAVGGNIDIHFLDLREAYYDGRLQVLKRDPSKKGWYDICGADIRGAGMKIAIIPLSIEGAILNNPDLPVTINGVGVADSEQIAKWRAEARGD